MTCNLSDIKVRATLGGLGLNFSTLDFIKACPFSGGSKSGEGCTTVQAEGGRSCCGKRLGEFARENPRRLQRTNEGQSPARWCDLLKRDGAPQSGSDGGTPSPRKPDD